MSADKLMQRVIEMQVRKAQAELEAWLIGCGVTQENVHQYEILQEKAVEESDPLVISKYVLKKAGNVVGQFVLKASVGVGVKT